MQVHIPQPCSEDWSAMTPSPSGRFCPRCAYTVIDFSEMSTAEIALYLQLNAGESVCGRFRADQIMMELPTPDEFVVSIVKAPLSLIRQIAAIIIFALFIGADIPAEAQKHNNPKPQIEQPELTGLVKLASEPLAEQAPDTQRNNNQILGRMPIYKAPNKGAKGAGKTNKDTTKQSSVPRHPSHMAGKIVRYLPPKK